MRFRAPVVVLLIGALGAGASAAPRDAAALLAGWETAGPDARRRIAARIEEYEGPRRFSEARCILLPFEDSLWPLERLFTDLLDPALEVAPQPQRSDDLGLLEIHLRALSALEALRAAYAAPNAVTSGTLNLVLGYAYSCLAAPALTPGARLRFFTEALRNVRDLDGRAAPDARTRWLVRHRLLPLLLGVAGRAEEGSPLQATVSEAASLFFLPGLLDGEAQASLAPLTRGMHTRDILARAYRDGALDAAGVAALARSVSLEAADDAAFATSAAPTLLELICDERLPGIERGAVLDTVLSKLAVLPPLRGMARDLLASAHSGPPRPLQDYRPEAGASVELPRAPRLYRFLQVVLLKPEPDRPPGVSRVVRADVPAHAPIRAQGEARSSTFLGALVPAEDGENVDFLGPPPGLSGARDHRLLRRTLRLERIAITTFGARGEEMELCVALPEDASEPVPEGGATLDDVLSLVRARLGRTEEEDERRDLIRLLAKIDTEGARGLAVSAARTMESALELLPLVDAGHATAAGPLLEHVGALPLDTMERVLGAAARLGDAGVAERVRGLCRGAAVAPAVLAADALLTVGDAGGVEVLLAHPSPYARAAATSLALRLTTLAGSLRVLPSDAAQARRVLEALPSSFDAKRDGALWGAYAKWLALPPDEILKKRHEHGNLYVDGRVVSPANFAEEWARRVRDGEQAGFWNNLAAFVLMPEEPGRGIPAQNLGRLLDALEARAKESRLGGVWRDALVALACAQQGMEAEPEFLDLARARLRSLAGEAAPPGADRKPGVFWPIWAAAQP